MYALVYVWMRAIGVCVYVYVYVYVYVHMCVCVYVCMYIWVPGPRTDLLCLLSTHLFLNSRMHSPTPTPIFSDILSYLF